MKPETDSLGDFLDEVKSVGFSAVEFWSPEPQFEELIDAALSRGLRVVSFVGHGHESPTDGSHAEGFSRRANHERLVAELRESIDLASKYEIPGLITLSGHRNSGESDTEALEICAEGLKRIAPYAEEKGVNLNMELLNSTVDHPYYLCDHTDWAVSLCERVNSPRCKILYDIYHMQIMEGNLISNIQRAAQWIGHYHTAGVPGRNDLDDAQEINYPALAKAIRATGYDLYVGHEFMPKGDAIAALRQAYQGLSSS
ncbi:MAG TPA: xylose isomerase [Opitutae bacterium]|nr:xylose isomerase [Opitutae bacterium]